MIGAQPNVESDLKTIAFSPSETVDEIRKISPRSRGNIIDTSPFHLSPCGGCSAPMWQQPCALCGFYPMGRASEIEIEIDRCRRQVPNPRASFISAIELAGNIAVWYISGWRKSVAWRDHQPGFRRGIEALEARAATLNCASGEEICNALDLNGSLPVSVKTIKTGKAK